MALRLWLLFDCLVISANTNGIRKSRREDVGCFQGKKLPRSQCVELHIIQPVGGGVWGSVEHVRAEQAVLLGKLVVDTGSEEILVDHLLPGRSCTDRCLHGKDEGCWGSGRCQKVK